MHIGGMRCGAVLLHSTYVVHRTCIAQFNAFVDTDFGYNDLGLHNALNENVIRTPHLDFLAQGDHGHGQPETLPRKSPCTVPKKGSIFEVF